jgi:hypothetical protein
LQVGGKGRNSAAARQRIADESQTTDWSHGAPP